MGPVSNVPKFEFFVTSVELLFISFGPREKVPFDRQLMIGVALIGTVQSRFEKFATFDVTFKGCRKSLRLRVIERLLEPVAPLF